MIAAIAAKLKRKWPELLLFLGSLMTGLLTAEMVMRWLYHDTIVLFPRFFTVAHYDGVTLRRVLPNFEFRHSSVDGIWRFRTNNKGFRDTEDYNYEKPAEQRRILVLGDSHTQGFEVNQDATFSSVLRKRLRARGLQAQVLNTGISGFGTAEQLLFLEREGLKYKPDVVVLAFFDNDFDDNVRSQLFKLTNKQLEQTSNVYIPGVSATRFINSIPTVAWLSQHSYVYSVLLNTVWFQLKMAALRHATEDATFEQAIRVTEASQYKQDLAAALLLRMKKSANDAGIPLIIVEIPGVDVTGKNAWLPSVDGKFEATMAAASDIFIPAASYLGSGQNGLVHVPHGHRHISEMTHSRIAEAIEAKLGCVAPSLGRCLDGPALPGGAQRKVESQRD